MTQAKDAPTYQCLLGGSFFQNASGGPNAPITSYNSLFLPGDGSNGNEYAGNQTYNMQFWVLLDQNPDNAPQQFVAPDAQTVPAGLAALMNSQHLLVTCLCATSNLAPSGALYDFMMANGSGAALTTLESLNASLACGTGGLCVYGMISIPGQGPNSGIEWFINPAPVTYAAASGTAWGGQFPFVLMPDGAGGYVPFAQL
jgi:hypothetical protein